MRLVFLSDALLVSKRLSDVYCANNSYADGSSTPDVSSMMLNNRSLVAQCSVSLLTSFLQCNLQVLLPDPDTESNTGGKRIGNQYVS